MSIQKTAPGLCLCVFAGFLMGIVAPARACTVSLGIPGNPPFSSIENGQVTGVVAEITVLALRNMGCRVQPRELPYARMYNWVHGGKLDVATAVRKTPERAALAHYSEPIISEYQLIMVPKDGLFPLRTLEDLAGMDIGGQLGFLYPQIQNGKVNLLRARNFEINVNRVARKRLDGAVIGSIAGPHIADRMVLSNRVAYLPRALDVVQLGTALSTQAFSQKMRTRFDAEIRSLMTGRLWGQILATNKVPVQRKIWPLLEATRQP
ncbi:MAG: transporter substrate-binding domain-containing protein [Rhodospirillaceae bacterium]|nr:transporter substrate-binding domain-containing protein [Rhodospirillaceae bacterium]